MPRWDRVGQVIAITLVDAFGVSLLSLLFYAIHSDCALVPHVWSLNIPAIVTTVLSIVLLILLLVSLSTAQLALVCGSFFPIWGSARVTELFKLGTFWALQVQVGAFKKLPKDARLNLPDPYLTKLLAAIGDGDEERGEGAAVV